MLDLARVVDIHPESHSVDIVMMQDGRRMTGVQVMTGMAGTNVGSNDLPSPSELGFDAKTTHNRDIYAVVSFVGAAPIVLGFLFPQVAQCLFKDRDRMVYRHASDVYVTVDGAGNTEVAHPSGAFLRIGKTPAHEDLTGKDYDKIWKITKNKTHDVHIHVEQAGGVASANIDPTGNITVLSNANITVKADQTLRLEGNEVHLHAQSIFRFDVNGHGQKWDATGVETWQDDDVPKPHHVHAPPEIS